VSDEIDRAYKWLSSIKLLVGIVVGAFFSGGTSYLAWGAVAKKSAVDAALVEVRKQITSNEAAHTDEAMEIQALRGDVAHLQDDVRRVRDVVESWAKPPGGRR